MDIEWEKIVDSENIYEFPKTIKENVALFSNWMSFMTSEDAKEFYRDNNIKLKNKVSGTDLKWSKGIENKFYEVVSNVFQPAIAIQAFNEVTDENNSISNKIGPDKKTFFKGLNKLEEINHFLNAKSYSEPAFKEEMIKKSIYCLFYGDLDTMKDLSTLMSNNVDPISIKGILNKININHTRINVAEDFNSFKIMQKKSELKKFNQPIPKFCGGVFSFGIAHGLINFDWFKNMAEGKTKEAVEGIQSGIEWSKPVAEKIIHSHNHFLTTVSNTAISAWDKVEQFGLHLYNALPQQYHDYKTFSIVVGVGLVLYPIGKQIPKFLVKAVDSLNNNKINLQNVEDFNKKNYLEFFIKKDLIEGIIKKEEYNLNNTDCNNHIDLIAFAIRKLDNPALKAEDFKDSNGQSIVEKLGLKKEEFERLNALTTEEIHSCSQIQNVDFRDVMLKNRFTNQELLLVKRIEAQQAINGYGLLKGDFFETPNEVDLNVKLRGFMFSVSPIKTAIINNILKIGAKKENDKLVLDNNYVNLIPKDNSVDLYEKLNSSLKINLDDKKVEKSLEKKLKAEKYNNEKSTEKLQSVFNSYGVNIAELNKILKQDDSVGTLIKNKAMDVMEKIRSKFSSSTSGIRP